MRRHACIYALLTALTVAAPLHADDLAIPKTRAEYEVFKKAQEEASNVAYRSGDHDRAETIEAGMLQLSRRFGDRKEEALSMYGLGTIATVANDLKLSEKYMRDSIEIWQSIGDQRGVAMSLRGLGRTLEVMGRLPEATEVQVAALEIMLKHGKPMDQSESYYGLSKLFMNLGSLPAALSGVDRSIALMGDDAPHFPLGLNLALRSTILREMGKPDAALKDAHAAAATFAQANSKPGEAIGQLALGTALSASGNTKEALETLRSGAVVAEQVGERVLLADLWIGEGRAFLREKRFQEALPVLIKANAIAEELKLDRTLLDTSLALEEAWSGLDQPSKALAANKRAFAAQARIADLKKIGQIAGRSAESQLAALNSRFMSLDPAIRASQPILAKPEPKETPIWWWLLPAGLLGIGLLFALRHAGRIRARQQDLETEHAKLRDHSEHLRQQVSLDPLTGAMTRRAFAEELEAMLSSAHARNRHVSLVIFDLDHFKSINDQHGHMAGDTALKLLVGLVREQLQSDDLLGRFGGDEFLIASRQPMDLVAGIAERIRDAVERRSRNADSGVPPLTISVGLAQSGPESGYASDSLFLRADAALYAAKDAGRNRVVLDDGNLPTPGDPRSLRHKAHELHASDV